MKSKGKRSNNKKGTEISFKTFGVGGVESENQTQSNAAENTSQKNEISFKSPNEKILFTSPSVKSSLTGAFAINNQRDTLKDTENLTNQIMAQLNKVQAAILPSSNIYSNYSYNNYSFPYQSNLYSYNQSGYFTNRSNDIMNTLNVVNKEMDLLNEDLSHSVLYKYFNDDQRLKENMNHIMEDNKNISTSKRNSNTNVNTNQKSSQTNTNPNEENTEDDKYIGPNDAVYDGFSYPLYEDFKPIKNARILYNSNSYAQTDIFPY